MEFVDGDECSDATARSKCGVTEDALKPPGFLKYERTIAPGHHHDPGKGNSVHLAGFVETIDRDQPISHQPCRMLDETHLGTVFSEAINVPLEPGEDIRDARIEAAGANDDWTRRHVGQRLAINVVALHQARLLIGSDRNPVSFIRRGAVMRSRRRSA